ncbi:O-antigen polymerase [Polaribacter sp. MED152]|nr:O-antigen polymerase [Polaribacter sp. MED152]
MKHYFLNFLKKSDLSVNELFSSLILCSLMLPRIVNSLAIGLFFIYSIIIFFKYKGTKFRFTKISLFFISFFVICVLSLFWSIDLTASKEGISRIVSFILIPISFSVNYQKIRPLKIFYFFSYFTFFVALLMLLKAIINYFQTKDYHVFFYHNLSNTISDLHAIYFSIFVSFSIFLLLLKDKNKLDLVVTIFLIPFLFLLSSKTVIVISFILWISFFKKNFLFLKKGFIAVITLLLLSSVFFKERIFKEINNSNLIEIFQKENFGWQYKWSGIGIRTLQIRTFYELLNEDDFMLHGYGYNAVREKIIKKHKSYKLYSGMVGIDFHNQYLQLIAEVGLLGLFIILMIFMLSIKKAVTERDLLFFSFSVLLIFVCITEIYLARQRGLVFFVTTTLLFVYGKKIQHKIIKYNK